MAPLSEETECDIESTLHSHRTVSIARRRRFSSRNLAEGGSSVHSIPAWKHNTSEQNLQACAHTGAERLADQDREWISLMSSLGQMQAAVSKLAVNHEGSEKPASCGTGLGISESPTKSGRDACNRSKSATRSPTRPPGVKELDFSHLSDSSGDADALSAQLSSPCGGDLEVAYSTSFESFHDDEEARRPPKVEPSPRTEQGSHRILVRNFPWEFPACQRKDTVPFHICGQPWFLRLYPGGFSEKSREFIGVFVCYGGTSLPVTASYGVSLFSDCDGSESPLVSLRFAGKTFTKTGQGRGWDTFVRRDDLRRANPDGCFSLLIDMELDRVDCENLLCEQATGAVCDMHRHSQAAEGRARGESRDGRIESNRRPALQALYGCAEHVRKCNSGGTTKPMHKATKVMPSRAQSSEGEHSKRPYAKVGDVHRGCQAQRS